jgi:hypothetical protein
VIISLGSFIIAKVAQILGNFFQRNQFEKNGMGNTLGYFFTSSSGVDVTITIFCDFANFLRKNWRFPQKPIFA